MASDDIIRISIAVRVDCTRKPDRPAKSFHNIDHVPLLLPVCYPAKQIWYMFCIHYGYSSCFIAS